MTAEELFSTLIQALPGDQGTLQNVLRVLAIPAAARCLSASASNILDTADLLLDTSFEGPWTTNSLNISFTKDDGLGNTIPNTDSKNVGLYQVLGGREYALVEFHQWNGTGISLTDNIKMGPGDQIRIRAHGTGHATAEVRGELR